MNTQRSYGGRSAAERAAERRGRLVEATIHVLAADGEARTTVAAVCARAGLTERYFYESFSTRDDALIAALDLVCDELLRLATEVIETAPGTAEDRVRAVMEAFVGYVEQFPDRVRVAALHSSANPVLRARRHDLLTVFADFAARESAALYGDAAWPAPRAHLQGLVWIGGFSELVASWLTGEVALTAEELVEISTDVFVALARR